MIGLLVISHYSLGQSYQQIAEHFFGKIPDNVRIMGINRDCDPQKMTKLAKGFIKDFGKKTKTLVLSDIIGATPCNISTQLVKPGKVHLITGLNAPMFIKACQYSTKTDDLEELTYCVYEAATEGISILNEFDDDE